MPLQCVRGMRNAMALGCLMSSLAACMGDVVGDEDLDPAAWVSLEEMSDEGPLPEDELAGDAADGTELYASTVKFQLPFPCGQVWAGQTRTNHSPQNSIDFNRNDDYGDKVVAAAPGKVTRVSNLGNVSYGRWVEIDHGGGYRTRYAHLATQTVQVGQVVSRGQKIGTVGSTGGSTGPHLHFEVRYNGAAIRINFNGAGALYFGTRNYTSQNSCGTSSVVGRVNTSGADLNVRAGASTSTAVVGSVSDGEYVTISCQKRGQSVTGTYGTSTLWDKIGAGYVADAYVSTGSDGQVAPDCP